MAKRHPGGRPKLKAADKFGESILLRLKPAQRRQIEADAKTAGLTVQEYMRKRLGL